VLADALGLTSQRALSQIEGYAAGRVGELPIAESLAEFANRVAAALPATAGGIRVAGDPDGQVSTVAVMGGSGDDQFDAVRASGADVYVTADLRHHPALEAREEARDGTPYLVDAGHWATESLWLANVRDRLLAGWGEDPAEPVRVETRLSTIRTEPWTFVVGANQAEPASGGAP
jgi:putative NIF3 family GTP cyclohydrolase 1 type 2